MNGNNGYILGIYIGSTTVKIAILNSDNDVVFSSYERHFANIQETLSDLLGRAIYKLGQIHVSPVITGSGGLTLAKHLGVPFVQEVVAVSTALQDYATQTDVAIELGGEDAKIIYFAREAPVPLLTRWLRCCRRMLPASTNMRKITKPYIPSLQDAAYLPSPIFSR